MADGEVFFPIGGDVWHALEKLEAQARTRDCLDTSWLVRDVPIDVRAMAGKAAADQGLSLGEWLTDLIIDRARPSRDVVAAMPSILSGFDDTPIGPLQPASVFNALVDEGRLELDTGPVEATASLTQGEIEIETDTVTVVEPDWLLGDAVVGDEIAAEPPQETLLLADGDETGAPQHDVDRASMLAPLDELAAILDSVRHIVDVARPSSDAAWTEAEASFAADSAPSEVELWLDDAVDAPPAAAAQFAEISDDADAQAGAPVAVTSAFDSLFGVVADSEADGDPPRTAEEEAWASDARSLAAHSTFGQTYAETVSPAAVAEDMQLESEAPCAEITAVEADAETWLPRATPAPRKSFFAKVFGG